MFGDGRPAYKQAVIIVHSLPDVKGFYEDCGFTRVCQLKAKNMLETECEKRSWMRE